MTDDIERLLDYGRIGLETGYYEQARDNFEQVLALDPSNREAMKGLARANEMLSRREDVQPARQARPARQEPARPTHTAEPQRTVPGRSRVENKEDSMESKADDNLEWLSLQLRHVPLKTWIIVLAKIGVAVMCWILILAVIRFVSSLILAQIDISIAEVWGDFLEMVR